jgi:hypothetical protein
MFEKSCVREKLCSAKSCVDVKSDRFDNLRRQAPGNFCEETARMPLATSLA